MSRLLSRYFCAFFLIIWCLPAHSKVYQEAVASIGFSELAATFSAEKVKTITHAPLANKKDLAELQAQAVLMLLGAPMDKVALAEFVAHFNQHDSAYLGKLEETSIFQRVETRWKNADNKPHSAFALDLREVISQGVATGYNIYTTSWPVFAKDRHLVYGHNDIDHAQQLLALLASEKVQAKVGFSFKTSAFLHRPDWGTPSPEAFNLGDGRYLNEAREYDLHFEFMTATDKARFMEVINRYAKRDKEEQQGLILKAWWQPYYRSLTAAPGFHAVTQILVSNGHETAVLLALQEKAPALVKNIADLDKGWEINPETIWVNPAFYRYLQGGYK